MAPVPAMVWASRPPKSAPSHLGTAVSRVAVVAILSFICGLVLSLGTIAEPIRRGSLGGSGYGGCSLLSATGSDSTGSGGPVLSIDVDITDDRGDEVGNVLLDFAPRRLYRTPTVRRWQGPWRLQAFGPGGFRPRSRAREDRLGLGP